MLSVLKVYFFSRNFTPWRHFWPVVFMSCIFMSGIFMSCNFMSCNFMSCKLVRHFHVLLFYALHIGPSISCPVILCPAILMVRHFHVQHFQLTPWGDALQKSQACVVSNRTGMKFGVCVFQDHALIDGVGYMTWCHTFNMMAMTSAHRSCYICSSVRRLPASPPSACDVIGSLYALQFLIHRTFALVNVIGWIGIMPNFPPLDGCW